MSRIKSFLTSVILLSALIITQCGKSTNPPSEPTILGNWVWESSIGGIAGTTRTPETEGYSVFLSFMSDSTFTRAMTDTAGIEDSYEGSYYVAYEEIPFWSHIDSAYVLYMDNAMPAILEMTMSELGLVEMCADCFGHTYLRITE